MHSETSHCLRSWSGRRARSPQLQAAVRLAPALFSDLVGIESARFGPRLWATSRPSPSPDLAVRIGRRMPAPALIAARFGACLADTAPVGGERGSRAPANHICACPHAEFAPPGAPLPAEIPRPLRLQIISLRPGRAAGRRRLASRGKAHGHRLLAILAGGGGFSGCARLARRRVIVQGVNMLGEARRRMAHGSGGARKDLPARCGRDSGWVARPASGSCSGNVRSGGLSAAQPGRSGISSQTLVQRGRITR